MEQKNQQHYSSSYFYDPPIRKVFEDFISNLKPPQCDITEQFLDVLYRECKKEKALISKTGNLQLNNLRLNHFLKVQLEVERLTSNGSIKNFDAPAFYSLLSQFSTYLTKKEIVKIYYRSPNNNQRSYNVSRNNFPILTDFDDFMRIRNYSNATINYYRISIKHFLVYSAYGTEKQYSSNCWRESINKFEEYLRKRAITEKITFNTAYAYLKAVKLFMRFLYGKGEITFHYNVPKRFCQKGKRSNEYINIHEVLSVGDSIFNFSKDILRDISILLILLETGCRPIEVVNLNLDDVYVNEKQIVLKSIKSDQRTLSLTESTFLFIKDYLTIRKNYLPQENTHALFLYPSGKRMASYYISYLIRKYNLKTFKEVRFTAKTLRHTFITNALNNHNNLDQVRDIVGHKHSVSTYYYFYRDINRLKNIFNGKKIY
ncbi:tyrosine-type recombinase/integrase [Sporosarcina highlanderae]|uniref:Site-specific integrase n=1 Tax=Sporosarcina highlanderae TaxID=3035916 RepID=A0ABT8JQ22_9BACL|nr:site-specific integrase [Sporosarcina highlanderae]MDN4607170.1 site-specific integrase [Sporosarcina highlanderae]